jgi:hypothetical protein
MAVGGAAARLEELLDQIRLAFESVSQDVEHSKSQHNDYERRGSTPCVAYISIIAGCRNANHSNAYIRT